MGDDLLLGIRHHLVPVPSTVWKKEIAENAHHSVAQLQFMSEDHHLVRDFVVRELPHSGKPLPPEWIAQNLGLTTHRIISILDELERNMTFIYRDNQGAVTWAYPVTVDTTPHKVQFSSGEKIYAAWAVDAIATPFVQGQLHGKRLSFLIETECAHCGEPIQIEIDSELKYRVIQNEAQPLVFTPQVDFGKLEDPNIIDAFWRKSVFFWSEEHARDYRKKRDGDRGTYMTLEQSAYVTPIVQGGLFAFPREGHRQ